MDITQITGLEYLGETPDEERTASKISLEVIAKTPQEKRCPHLSVDEEGPYCKKDFNNMISVERQMACDHVSLQLYCCGEYQNCCLFNGTFQFKE
mgnify:FL=1